MCHRCSYSDSFSIAAIISQLLTMLYRIAVANVLTILMTYLPFCAKCSDSLTPKLVCAHDTQ